jgi:Ulp1 family protease
MLYLDISKAYDTSWRYAILKKLKEWKMILFITNSTKSRSFRVTIRNTFSTNMNIENGIVQGAVISVTFPLIAMTDICKRTKEPTKMIGYVTNHKQLQRVAEARLKKAADKVSKWANENGFGISDVKAKYMFITEATES